MEADEQNQELRGLFSSLFLFFLFGATFLSSSLRFNNRSSDLTKNPNESYAKRSRSMNRDLFFNNISRNVLSGGHKFS